MPKERFALIKNRRFDAAYLTKDSSFVWDLMSKQQEMWDNQSVSWGKKIEDPGNYFARRASWVAQLIAEKMSGGNALDVGCGSGLLSKILAERGFDVYGTDISEKMIKKSIAALSDVIEAPEARFRVCENMQIPFEGMKFGLISGIGVLQYVQKRSMYIKNLASFLEHGGFLILSSSNRLSLFVILSIFSRILRFRPTRTWLQTIANLARTGIWSGGFIDYKKAERIYSASALDKLVTLQGFELIDSIDTYYLKWLDKNPFARTRMGKPIARSLGWNHIGIFRKI